MAMICQFRDEILQISINAAARGDRIPERTRHGPTQTWDRTFAQSDKVDRKKITFTNRCGITLAGDLYTPKSQGPFAAIAVGGPFGAVKEQSSGLHARTLAERGFVTLAFDASYTGESGGEPRNLASPEINTEDFSAAVDCLGLLENVNRERIDEIAPRPVLLAQGSEAHSLYFSQTAYENAAEPKELCIVEGATHTDLYDQMGKIPFDKFTSFFTENL